MSIYSFEDIHGLVLQASDVVQFPDPQAFASFFAAVEPKGQMHAIQESLRLLAKHAKREAIVGMYDLFKRTIPDNTKLPRAKGMVTAAMKEVPAILFAITNQVIEKPAGKPEGDAHKNPGATAGKKVDPADPLQPGNGGPKPTRKYTDLQWLRILYSSMWRWRLLNAGMKPACLSLKPSVDLENTDRYPADKDSAVLLFEQMGETDFFEMFKELQSAVREFFDAPSLDDAYRLNMSLGDVRHRNLRDQYLAYFPENEKVMPGLVNNADSDDRMQTIMISSDVTSGLVAAGLAAYDLLVEEHLRKPVRQAIELRNPRPATTATDPPAPAPAGTGGQEPRLPRRVPQSPQNPQPRNQDVSTDNPQKPVAQGPEARPDLRPQELEKTRRELDAAKKAAEDAKKEIADAKKAAEDAKKEAAEAKKAADDAKDLQVRDLQARLAAAQVQAAPPAQTTATAPAQAGAGTVQVVAASPRRPNGMSRGKKVAVGCAVVGLVLIVLAGIVGTGFGIYYATRSAPTKQQPTAQQAQQAQPTQEQPKADTWQPTQFDFSDL